MGIGIAYTLFHDFKCIISDNAPYPYYANMKASIFLGQNAGKIEFNVFSTFKVFGCQSQNQIDKAIYKYFEAVSSVNEMLYSTEKKHNNIHSHMLQEVSDLAYFDNEVEKFIKPNKCQIGKTKALIKMPKSENDEITSVAFKDVYVDIDFKRYIGKKYELFIQKPISIKNAAYYLYKGCDYGINNGFLKRQALTTQ